jgi:FkbM family methyltransferase
VTIHGIRLVSDAYNIPGPLRRQLFREVYEEPERDVLLKVLKPGSKVVELGTGVGFIALLAAKICGEKNVWTYEANTTIESLIRENFRLNAMEPQLTMRAVTIDGRRLSFNVADNIISSSAFDRDTPSRMFNVESEVFLDVLKKHQPDVLIMDVEGVEYELLVNSDLLDVKDILVELHPHIIGQEKIDQIVSSLSASGFSAKNNDRKTFHFSRR